MHVYEENMANQPPQVAARIQHNANQTKPQTYDRHPADKAQAYKNEGAPNQEVIEFCTPNSSIENLDHYIECYFCFCVIFSYL